MRIPKGEQECDWNTHIGILEIIVLLAIGLSVILVFYIYQSVYINHYNTGTTRFIASTLLLPMGIVNGNLLMYDDIFALDQMAMIEFPNDDHFAHAVDAAIKQELIDELVSELDADFEFDKFSEIEGGNIEYGSYGWDEQMYEKYVLLPMQQTEVLQSVVLACQDCQQSVRIEMEHVKSLLDMGILFEDLAKQYSQVASSQFGGDIGYLVQDELEDGLRSLWDFDIDQMSGVIELSDRFVIAKVYNVIEVESVRERIGIQIIAMYKNGLQEVLEEEKQTAEIKIFGK